MGGSSSRPSDMTEIVHLPPRRRAGAGCLRDPRFPNERFGSPREAAA
jgi:hypothetical protein